MYQQPDRRPPLDPHASLPRLNTHTPHTTQDNVGQHSGAAHCAASGTGAANRPGAGVVAHAAATTSAGNGVARAPPVVAVATMARAGEPQPSADGRERHRRRRRRGVAAEAGNACRLAAARDGPAGVAAAPAASGNTSNAGAASRVEVRLGPCAALTLRLAAGKMLRMSADFTPVRATTSAMGTPLARSRAPRTMPYRFYSSASEAPRCQSSLSAAAVELLRRKFFTSSCDDACVQGGAARSRKHSQ